MHRGGLDGLKESQNLASNFLNSGGVYSSGWEENAKAIHLKFIDMNFTQRLWADCGHKTNYLDAKIKLISSRSFNTVKVNQAGVITKSSRHKLKTVDEFSFLQMLPQDISVFFPISCLLFLI